MLTAYDQALERIARALDAIRMNRPYQPLLLEEIPLNLHGVAVSVNTLARDVYQINTTVALLSKGMLDIELPPRINAMAGSVKQLHSHLRHLTWQTQQIAQGDYDQSVDFLGDFSAAFNQMTGQLKEREAKLQANSVIMGSVFDHIENLLIVNAGLRSQAYIINTCARRTFNIPDGVMDLTHVIKTSPFLRELLGNSHQGERQLEILDENTRHWYYVVISQLVWHGEAALLFYCTDMTVQKRREAMLEQDAMTDALTGVSNRRLMDLQIQRSWAHYRRLQLPVSMIIIDIDFFKQYNDSYGHQQGDACLRTVASCMLKTFCRATDLLARYGGEEFLAMLPNVDGERAWAIAEQLRQKIEAQAIPCVTRGERTFITCSFGVATCIPGADHTPQLLIQRADEALYTAKAQGRNRVMSVTF